MTQIEFLIIFGCCVVTMLASRVIPFFLLKEKKLPDRATEALNLIPPAAFAALVANDLFSPSMFTEGIALTLPPLLAAILVILVARKTKSLIGSVIVGVGAYALFALVSGAGI